MQFGSLFNLIAANRATDKDTKKPVEPEVGMGATEAMFSDRHAGTITAIIRYGKGAKKAGQIKAIDWQQDNATRTDSRGFSDAQDYTYERNPQGRTVRFYARPDGSFQPTGGGARLLIGIRDEHYDFTR